MTKVGVPRLREALVLLVQRGEKDVVAAYDVPAPLLHADIVVAVVVGAKVRSTSEAKLETHLGVAYRVAVLLAVVSDGKRRQTARPGLVHGLDDEGHVGRVFDLEVEAGTPASTLL